MGPEVAARLSITRPGSSVANFSLKLTSCRCHFAPRLYTLRGSTQCTRHSGGRCAALFLFLTEEFMFRGFAATAAAAAAAAAALYSSSSFEFTFAQSLESSKCA